MGRGWGITVIGRLPGDSNVSWAEKPGLVRRGSKRTLWRILEGDRWARVPVLLFSHCVNWGELSDLTEAEFSPLDGGISNSYWTGLS